MIDRDREIRLAEKRCRKAWEAAPGARWAWCCHHEVRVKPLKHPYANRIQFIIEFKSPTEIVKRLDNFRPVLSALPEKLVQAGKAYDKAREAYYKVLKSCEDELEALHKKDVPHNTWNGKDIF